MNHRSLFALTLTAGSLAACMRTGNFSDQLPEEYDCANFWLGEGAAIVQGTLDGAQNEIEIVTDAGVPADCGGNSGADVSYLWRATEAGIWRVRLSSAAPGLILEVATSCTIEADIECTEALVTAPTELEFLVTAEAAEFFVFVVDTNGPAGEFVLSVQPDSGR